MSNYLWYIYILFQFILIVVDETQTKPQIKEKNEDCIIGLEENISHTFAKFNRGNQTFIPKFILNL